ncbi:MAG TPA: chromosomal replication initiator protein DnaA [Caulobacteraceae bacterium]|nr:chromosomal replication initiator protein DnaA [Caulobacteraceae bacterium]
MATNGLAGMVAAPTVGLIWAKVAQTLKVELGEDTFGSWLAQASLRTDATGELCLVTPTGIARDWIRRYALRRIEELWSASDPDHKPLGLKSRLEFEADGGGAALPLANAEIVLAATEPVSSDSPTIAPVGPARVSRLQGLQERFTFDTFVKGPSNEFAVAVARRVASWADGHFNPVVFHAAYGFGKTHLLNALAWEATRTAPDKKVVYLTAERFLSSFVRALMDRKAADFKDELRSADLLLIDDVHFIGGKHSSEEELFHTLAALMEDGRRVVFSADRPPSALAEIDARLRSHLSAGLVCGIEPADRALRLDILERKAAFLTRQQGISARIRPEVLAFLADRFTESVRELEGALNTLIVRAGAGIGGLTLEETRSFLGPHLPGAERRITVDEIQKVTADHFGLKQADLISERRTRSVARPRQAAMWLAKKLTTRSLPDIGRRFGDRDHTTVLHAVRRIEELRLTDGQLARDLDALTRKLRR